MKLYLVREAGTTKVHGIFWADNATVLWDAVDAMGDPHDFEWAEITRAGGVWREGDLDEMPGVPDRADFAEPQEGQGAFDEAYSEALNFGFNVFGERLLEMIGTGEDHRSRRFDASDKGVGMVAWAMRRAEANRRQEKA